MKAIRQIDIINSIRKPSVKPSKVLLNKKDKDRIKDIKNGRKDWKNYE